MTDVITKELLNQLFQKMKEEEQESWKREAEFWDSIATGLKPIADACKTKEDEKEFYLLQLCLFNNWPYPDAIQQYRSTKEPWDIWQRIGPPLKPE